MSEPTQPPTELAETVSTSGDTRQITQPADQRPMTWDESWSDDGPPLNASFSTLPPELLGEAVAVAPEVVEAPAPAGPPERYAYLGKLGEGGMGEVWRVRDTELNRIVAMKVLRPHLLRSMRGLMRFREEAQVCAQLQHPGIVPVHDIGRLPDRRAWFTMMEVRGRTLADVSRDARRGAGAGGRANMGFRRLVDAFLRVCEAVGYAHARGVVHRDLKPDNVMIGQHGEVLVMDWGLAKVLALPDDDEDGIATSRAGSDAYRTRVGAVTGTPAYMAPEQAAGLTQEIAPTTDVWALGATLYDVLTGRLPYESTTVEGMLADIVGGGPVQPPSARGAPWPIPEELERVCMRCLARDPAERYPDASALADDVAAFLDGARKRARALEVLAEAREKAEKAAASVQRAAALTERAQEVLATVPAGDLDARGAAWDLEDEARRLEEQADLDRIGMVQLAGAALSHAPDLQDAHDLLADEYHRQHRALEAEGRSAEARRVESWLHNHDRGRYAAYLKGAGALTLVTDPPGAEVLLHRFEIVRRRLEPIFVRSLGRTPIVGVDVPMGSYLLTIRAEGHDEVRYPVTIGRQAHWDGVPPEGGDPLPIWLPPTGALQPDDCYVPAGWYWSGGAPAFITNPVPRRWLWCHPFVIKRFPVTNEEYVAFLNDLVATGRVEEAERYAPRIPPARKGELGQLLLDRCGDGTFALGVDAQGHRWLPDVPIVMVNWHAARAYAAWRATRDGVGWRLPWELEWEKAARGCDGRTYPWGEVFEEGWAHVRTTGAPQRPLEVGAYPADCSVFGVQDLVGNVMDWTLDPNPGFSSVEGARVATPAVVEDGRDRRLRGGHWVNTRPTARVDVPKRSRVDAIGGEIGTRLVRPLRER